MIPHTNLTHMNSHLASIAHTFANKIGKELHKYTFVFPNHRAGIFFRKYLTQALDQPIFAPKIVTINECFASLTSLCVANQLTLLLRLYNLYCAQRPNAEPLEQFLHWGKMMLADFSEIDNHLVQDVQSLYTLVEDMHQIDTHFLTLSDKQKAAIARFWGEFHTSKQHNKDSKMHTQFLRTWELLYPLYLALREDLLKDGLAYEGLLHRHVIEHWDNIPEDSFSAEYVFIGFNATTESERQLMLRLQEMGRADFYFDYNSDLLQDPHNAASRFMTDNLHLFRTRYTVSTEETTDIRQKNIQLISVSSSVSQTHQVHEILANQIPPTTDWTRTAIVLPNEELLIPLLHTIPSHIDKINVTMGYPLRATSSYMLIAYPEQYLSPMPQDPKVFIDSMRQQLLGLRNDTNSESIYQMLKTIDRIEESIQLYPQIEFSTLAVQQLLKMLTMEMTIPYTGEPLEGLQIMGVLETRALDFDNIIIADFNDDIYPGRAGNNSFIPYTLRHGFDLPTIERQDAIFAYNFYRMLSHAQNIWFIANTHADDQHSGELSRYYYQLLWQYQLPIQHTIINEKLQSAQADNTPITKTPKVLDLLSKYTASNNRSCLSPSALGTYLRCQKAFYYKYLERIHEKEQDETISISDMTLGNVLHAIMQYIYMPFEGKLVQKNDIHSLINDINNDQYWKQLEPLTNLQGDELAEKVIRSCINNTLYYDYEHTPFEYIASEHNSHRNIHLPSIHQDITLQGKIDRVDVRGNLIRIIDYKTGSAQLEFSSMQQVFGIDKKTNREEAFVRNKGNNYILQTLLYCWLSEEDKDIISVQNRYTNALTLSPHIYPVRQLHDITTPTCVHTKVDDIIYTNDIRDEFIAELTDLLEEIFNPEIPFSPTTLNNECENCYLAEICALKKE